MLERCFVTDAKLDQFQGDLQRALRDASPSYMPEAQELTPADRERILTSYSGDKKGRVILITGSVGCGKSTLVAKVLHEARQDRDRNQVYLVVDLIDEDADRGIDITTRLLQYITDKWIDAEPSCTTHDQLHRVFQPELARLRTGQA